MATTTDTLTGQQIAAMVGVKPRDRWNPMMTVASIKERGFNEARYCAGLAIGRAYQAAAEAAQMVLHLNTGRLSNDAALRLRETTPYRACKVIAAVAQADMTGLIEIERARVVARIIEKEA